jgi:PAS domain-containing protein
MLGQPVARIIPAERSEEEVQILAGLWRGEWMEYYETVRRHKDGRMIDVSLNISPIRNPGGRIIGACKIARDITERKKAEAATQRAQERLEEEAAVLELAPVLVRDMESRIVLWTKGAERLYGVILINKDAPVSNTQLLTVSGGLARKSAHSEHDACIRRRPDKSPCRIHRREAPIFCAVENGVIGKTGTESRDFRKGEVSSFQDRRILAPRQPARPLSGSGRPPSGAIDPGISLYQNSDVVEENLESPFGSRPPDLQVQRFL